MSVTDPPNLALPQPARRSPPVGRTNRSALGLTFFAGLSLLLFAFSPGSIRGMGYSGEEIDSGNSLLDGAAAVLSHRSPPKEVWGRHGVFPLIVDSPFLLAGDLFKDRDLWQDRLLACRPILLTAGIATILFLWTWRLTADPKWSLFVAFISVFSTILLPYAYIGLEDTQSFFLLLAAYLAFEYPPSESLPRTIVFACSAAFAVCTKSTGVFLIPATAYLIYVGFRTWTPAKAGRILFVAAFVTISLALSAVSRSPFWTAFGGTAALLKQWNVSDPLYYLANLFSFFFSANKGLFFYCPILLVAVFALPRLWRVHRELVIAALLTLFAEACAFSFLRVWTDETWGPRYLYPAVPFLMLCVGAGWIRRFAPPRSLILAPALVGFVFALLGSFFYYGSLQGAMTESGQDTLENFQGDIVWNHIRFNARLFWAWANHPPPPVLFTPVHQWYYEAPPGAAWKTIDLSKYAVPQALLLRCWSESHHGADSWDCRIELLSLLLGLILLASVAWSTRGAT